MEIVVAHPPNFEAIRAVFPSAADKGVLFCYGNTIFNPSDGFIPPALIAHEEVHCVQQAAVGVDSWWDQYLVDPQFRYAQELAAHIVEYHNFIRQTKNRSLQRAYLAAVASRLSGPLYGNAASFAEARDAIKQGR